MAKFIREVDIGDGLTLRSYTKAAFYKKMWTPEVILSRGHVTDSSGKYVSRPFDKFFNLGEMAETTAEHLFREHQNLPGSVFRATEKFNGHLAILFHHNGNWINTTKGGFNTEFTKRDRVIIDGCVDYNMLHTSFTYMFEIMDPEHDPHVLHQFMDSEFLNTAILIGVRDNESGKYVDLYDRGWVPGVQSHPVMKTAEKTFQTLAELEAWLDYLRKLRIPTEGWVVNLMSNGQPTITFKVKTKRFLEMRYYWYGPLKNAKKLVIQMSQGSELDCDEEVVPAIKEIYADAICNPEGLSIESWLDIQETFQPYAKYLAWNK